MSDIVGQTLMSVEAEAYCQSLEPFAIKDVGSPSWNRQHEKIEKLNMQAIMNAAAQENEFVKEFLINESKFPVLIHDLITTELWKKHVFAELVNMKFEPKTTFHIYMILYHEATLMNLLETTLYYQESCEACGDAALDLADYCHRKLVWLTARQQQLEDSDSEDTSEKNQSLGTSMQSVFNDFHLADVLNRLFEICCELRCSLKELVNQSDVLEFDITVKAISVMRYISDHISELPLSTATRLLNTHDLPVLLVELLQSPPWTRQSKENGSLQKYVDNKWVDIDDTDRFKITKIEGQVWLTLFKLLMDPDCQRKYELNPYRKNTLLKLRSFMNEMMLDQLPILSELQIYLERLSMMEPPAAQRDLVLEQIPEILDNITRENAKKWKKIAVDQSKKYFDLNESQLREEAKRWVDTYNFDALENLLTDPPKCAVCGEPATKRCSRCQNEWYCRRECQVAAWKKHKPACDLMHESLKSLELNATTSE